MAAMRNGKFFLVRIPEMILLLQTGFYWYYSSPLNPVALTLVLVLVLQLVFRHTISGFAVSLLFLALNLFMCLALASELREFSSWTESAARMLLVGGIMMGTGLTASALMLARSVKRLATSM